MNFSDPTVQNQIRQTLARIGILPRHKESTPKFRHSGKPEPTPENIEKGLTSKEGWERREWAERLDYLPSEDQILRGLLDEVDGIKRVWQARPDVILSPEVMAHVGPVFGNYQAEILSRWEARELKKRHAHITKKSQILEAL